MTIPAVFNVSEIDGTNGKVLEAAEELVLGDGTFTSVGDFNGDGFADFAIGAPALDDSAGKTFIFFGGVDGPELDTMIISGVAAGDKNGKGVAGGADFNGDGIDDLVIGSHDAGGGELYVVYGDTSYQDGVELDLAGLDGTAGFKIDHNIGNDDAGISVSLGDVNNDGLADVIYGAPFADFIGGNSGGAIVFYGTGDNFVGSVEFNSTGSPLLQAFTPRSAGDAAGSDVSFAGDINGDGIGDYLVAARLSNPDGVQQAGEVMVVFGSEEADPANLSSSQLDGTNGFSIAGTGFFARLSTVSAAGDVNGDGIDDFIVGEIGQSSDTGRSYVIFGTDQGFETNFDLSTLDGTNGFVIEGAVAGDALGTDVGGVGDINGDGFGDILIGAPTADPDGLSAAGEAYVIFGAASGFAASMSVTELDGANGFTIRSDTAGDNLGQQVAFVGDVDGDGYDDILVGASPGDVGPDGYLIYGFAPEQGVFRRGSDGGQTILGGGFDDRLVGLGGDDVLKGFAGDDRLDGGTGDDLLLGGDGADDLRGGAGDDQLDGGADDDLLRGEGGSDLLLGGAGDDIYLIDEFDTVTELAGEGIDEVRMFGFDYTLEDNLEILRIRAGAVDGTGNALDNKLFGSTISNTLRGRGGDDLVDGKGGRDILEGNDGNDILVGGGGKDTLTGGSGADRFVWRDLGEGNAGAGAADVITDFSQAEGDRISFANIDAVSGGGTANDDFTFIGQSGFSGTAGELRFAFDGAGDTIVQLDVDGDASVDMSVRLTGEIELTAGDFLGADAPAALETGSLPIGYPMPLEELASTMLFA